MERNDTLAHILKYITSDPIAANYEIQITQDNCNYNTCFIHIVEGRYEDAQSLLDQLDHPFYTAMLYGYLYEKMGNFLKAYLHYRKAGFYKDFYQVANEDIIKLLQRCTPKITSAMFTKGNQYSVRISDQTESLTFSTEFDFLKKRKEVMYTILETELSIESLTEIDCLDGLVIKFFANLGVKAAGITNSNDRLNQYIYSSYWETGREKDLSLFPPMFVEDQIPMEEPFFDKNILIHPSPDCPFSLKKILSLLEQKCSRVIVALNLFNEEQGNEILTEILNHVPHGFEVWKNKFLVIIEKPSTNITNTPIIPYALQALKTTSIIFTLDVEKCCDFNGFRYTMRHPFVETLKQYRDDPNISYQQTKLYQFFKYFRPQNMMEQYFLDHGAEVEQLKPLNEGWMFFPWIKSNGAVRSNTGTTRKGGNHLHGPNTFEFGNKEFSRLKKSYDVIKKYEYHPELVVDGYVNGYFLKGDSGDYRFIVYEGQHRMAALSALGYSQILCRFNLSAKRPRVVKLSGSDQWYLVNKGKISRDKAELLFNSFFQDNSRHLYYGEDLF